MVFISVKAFFVLLELISHRHIYPSTEALAAIVSFDINLTAVTGVLCTS